MDAIILVYYSCTPREGSFSYCPAISFPTASYDDYAYVAEAIELGVSGYLLKTATGRELVDAVRTVAAGDFVLSGSVAMRFAGRRQSNHGRDEVKLNQRV